MIIGIVSPNNNPHQNIRAHHTHTYSTTFIPNYNMSVRLTDLDYTLSGRRRAPRTYEELKRELNTMRKAKGKLYLEFGYETGCKHEQFAISMLCKIVDDLKTSYKKNKTAVPKEERKKRKELWKKTRKCVKAVANSAARVIQFCLKETGKKNLAEMQQATRSPMFCGWKRAYISRRYEIEKGMFEKQFENIEETDRASWGQPRAYDDVSIPYHIRSKVIAEWKEMHYACRKDLLYVDIWNREKKFEPVRDELMHYLAPDITFTLCWANPLCVFGNSLCKKKSVDVKRDATNSYREAKKMSLKYWKERGRVNDALIVYWWQKDNFKMSWRCHPFDSNIVAVLKGSLPKKFTRMWHCWNEHVQYLYNAADKDRKGYSDAGANLCQWKSWTEGVKSDLEILLEGVKKVGVHAFEESAFRRCKTLKGCTRDILLGDCREYVGYIGESQEY